MDRRGGGWSENGATDHNTLANDLDGDESSHHYYCPINMGGVCSCSLQEHTNNNDYSKLKKSSKSKRSNNYYSEESAYTDPYNAPSGEGQYFDTSNDYATYATSSSYTKPRDLTYCNDCTRCNQTSVSNCGNCNAHQNASYCDYFDPSKTYGCPTNGEQASFTPPKIQVTAKILFGTVSAITEMKQKKTAKKK